VAAQLTVWAVLLGLVAGARRATAQQPLETPPPSPPRIRFINPEPDALLAGTSVPVVLEIQGVEIAPVIERRPGTAHVVLFLDRDVTMPDSAVPFGTPGIVHLLRGRSWHTLDFVKPGAHRLIALLANPRHVPLQPLAADTVRFTVKPRR